MQVMRVAPRNRLAGGAIVKSCVWADHAAARSWRSPSTNLAPRMISARWFDPSSFLHFLWAHRHSLKTMAIAVLDGLVFERPPQAFDKYVVHAAAPPIHGDCNARVLEDAGEVEAGELASLVGVEDTVWPPASPTSASRSLLMICSGVCRFRGILTSFKQPKTRSWTH